jgi:hypothetical protein
MGRNFCPMLLANIGAGMITSMGRDRTQQATSDLLSTAQMPDLGFFVLAYITLVLFHLKSIPCITMGLFHESHWLPL